MKPYSIRTTVISPGAVGTELPNSVTKQDVADGVKNFYKEFAIPAKLIIRAGSHLRNQPAGGGHKRDPFPAYMPRVVG